MAAGGARDIFLAYPMVGEFRIRRALELRQKVDRLILAVDSIEGAHALEKGRGPGGHPVGGAAGDRHRARRTGVLREQAVSLAKAVAALPHLRLTGIYTFKSLVFQGQPTTDNEAAAGKRRS